jgi:hypothetical protein
MSVTMEAWIIKTLQLLSTGELHAQLDSMATRLDRIETKLDSLMTCEENNNNPDGPTSPSLPAPPTLPSDIKGLQAWYDMSDTNTIITDCVDAHVKAVRDKSAHNRLLQNYRTSGLYSGQSTCNGKNVVDFNSSSLVGANNIVNYAAHTLVMVVKPGHLGSDIYGSGGTSDGNVLFMTLGDGRCRGHHWRGTSTNAVDSFFFSLMNVDEWCIVVQRTDSHMDLLKVNMHDRRNEMSAPATSVHKGIVLGSRDGVTNNFTGSFAEVAVYDRFLSNLEIDMLCQSLASKWGLTWTNIVQFEEQ